MLDRHILIGCSVIAIACYVFTYYLHYFVGFVFCICFVVIIVVVVVLRLLLLSFLRDFLFLVSVILGVMSLFLHWLLLLSSLCLLFCSFCC